MISLFSGKLFDRLQEPVDARGLAVFRIAFGLTMCFGALRFLWNGWVDRFFVEPTYFFTYWGFEWVRPLPGLWMHAAFVLLALLAAAVAAGFFYRFAIVGFALLFTYVELIDATNYLNHYYFVSLMAVILAFLPANAKWSVDAFLRPSVASASVPRLSYSWLRFQVAAVWLSAALAKVTGDWLLHAQPLNIWLNARVDTAIIGPYLDIWEVALAASWAGFLYDASVPFLLMCRKTRPFAFAAVVGFHFMTHVFFTIGMFPLIMVVSATIFFEPDWPARGARAARRWRMCSGGAEKENLSGSRGVVPGGGFGVEPSRAELQQGVNAGLRPDPKGGTPLDPHHASLSSLRLLSFATPSARPHSFRRGLLAFVALWCIVQVTMPLRFLAYDGNILWDEQGMRWAFKVLCREKNGSVTYKVRLPAAGREFEVPPRHYLTKYQEREMSGQPDMILRLAHSIADDWRAKGHPDVEVRVDAIASLNGRPPQQLIDPDVNLAAIPDGIARAPWILEAPSEPPPRIGRSR